MDGNFVADLVCPACEETLAADGECLRCTSCSASYPVVQHVPLLLSGMRVLRGAPPEAGFVDDMAMALMPHSPDRVKAGISTLFSTHFVFPDPQLSCEGNRFVHRLRASGYQIRETETPPTAPDDGSGAVGGLVQCEDLEIKLVTAPKRVRVGQKFWVQVRIVNRGRGRCTATGENAVALRYAVRQRVKWYDMMKRAALNGHAQSKLLIDLPPGQELTQPVEMIGPRHPGAAEYRIMPVMGGADWPNPASITVVVTGTDAGEPDPFEVDWPYNPVSRGYADDRYYAIELVLAWTKERFAAGAGLKILELGGNAAPMLQSLGASFADAAYFNVDIDPYGLVFGTTQRRFSAGPVIQDAVADGTRLPFKDGSLDVIVMFATLHHFPQPSHLLRNLARKLQPNGIIIACCEPVGHVSHDALPADFRAELMNGICEQAFEPWEWRCIFDEAGLSVLHAQHDRGSLKVALEMRQTA